MISALSPHLGKEENRKRSKALDKLKTTKESQLHTFDEGDCRALGDAVFSFYCEKNQVILTTNVTDHTILATALGKKVVSPDAGNTP
jgi:hypothetical protein